MKKLIIANILFMCILIAAPGILLANSGTIGPSNAPQAAPAGIGDSFQLSTGVTITYNLGPNGTATSYALESAHVQGVNIYGAASGNSDIFVQRKAKAAGVALTATPTASDSGAFSGWAHL